MTAIFLDVDGVLNCLSTKEFIPGTEIFGVEDEKAAILNAFGMNAQDIKLKAKELSAELARIEEEAAEKKAAEAVMSD